MLNICNESIQMLNREICSVHDIKYIQPSVW